MFIEWPDREIKNNASPFIIKVIGNKQYYNVIRNFYSRYKIRNKPVDVTHIHNVNEINDCHILFITEITLEKLEKIIEVTRKSSVLTISDTKGYALKGVLINLFIVENKIRFEINKKAVESSGLVLSYHLLKFAKIVGVVNN